MPWAVSLLKPAGLLICFLLSCILDPSSAELETPCDAAASGCEGEDDLRYLDASLLQLALQLHQGPAELYGEVLTAAQELKKQARPSGVTGTAIVLKGLFHLSSYAHVQLALVLLATLFFIFCSVRFLTAPMWHHRLELMSDSVFLQSTTPPAATSLLESSAYLSPLSQAVLEAPPPLCAPLDLPHIEAQFIIALDALEKPLTGPIDITDPAGRKRFQASSSHTPDGRRSFALASVGEDDPRALVLEPRWPPSQNASTSMSSDTHQDLAASASTHASMPDLSPLQQEDLELYGYLDGFYGHIESRPGGISSILHHGSSQNPVMYLELGSQQDLHMTATTETGNLLASAGRSSVMTTAPGAAQQPISKDVWSLLVQPGTDPVLIASCMLALIFLKPWYQDDPN
mmetsp:Transcript_55692/g.92274  ORF Transcript_55692/g.92274 Transcript_55692/m.92274 type:complete len:402 (-) Transcript_55692:9-1214(-)